MTTKLTVNIVTQPINTDSKLIKKVFLDFISTSVGPTNLINC